MLIRGTEQGDVRVEGAVITEVGALERLDGEPVIEGRGGALIPGLADHHLHLAAAAMARVSVDLSDGLAPLRAAEVRDGWLRGVGVQPDDLPTPADLDALRSDVPVRVQDRGGSVWVLNTRAQEVTGLDGVLWRSDPLLRHRAPLPAPDVTALADELLAMGLTHLTDATPDLEEESADWLERAVPQHLLCLGTPTARPYKIVLGDHDLPSFDALRTDVVLHRPAAFHCVTAAALALIIAVLEDVGAVPGDRIEHGAVIPPDAIASLRDLGVAVVTQPTIWAARHQRFERESDPIDVPDLWRHRSLIEGGVLTVCSSDAPYGDPDPWATMRAARDRLGEGAEPGVVLDGLLRDPQDLHQRRSVAPGQSADLVLLHAPLAEVLRDPTRDAVRAVILRGTLVS